MDIIERHTSPDGSLVLVVSQGASPGDLAVGFEGSDWHVHASTIAPWLDVPEDSAVAAFVAAVLGDGLQIIASVDGGRTLKPWISDNLEAMLKYEGSENCVLRVWSGPPWQFER